MASHLFNSRLVFLVCGALLAASAAQAQATRTWISGVGDDAFPCSRTSPCKTFAGAMSKTATNGEIDVLDPGGFGAVTIPKSITLDGTTGQGFGSILANGGINGIVINAANGTVRIRNLSINGTGGAGLNGVNGIKILAAANVHIENVVIANFSNRGISDERSGAGKLFVTNTIVRNNGQSGIAVAPVSGSVNAMFDGVVVEGNGLAGIAIGNGSKATARNSTAAGNSTGFYADSVGTDFNLESCVSHGNGTGILASNPGTPTIRLSNCAVFNNTTNGVQTAAGTMLTYGNNRIGGNTGNQGGLVAANPAVQ